MRPHGSQRVKISAKSLRKRSLGVLTQFALSPVCFGSGRPLEMYRPTR